MTARLTHQHKPIIARTTAAQVAPERVRRRIDATRAPAWTGALHPTGPVVQRKLLMHSASDATAFKWYFSPADAALFEWKGVKGKPLEISMKAPPAGGAAPTPEDEFRVNMLKAFINHPTESLLIRAYPMDTSLPTHELWKNGKKVGDTDKSFTMRTISGNILGAGGVTIPSKPLAVASDPNYSGSVTSEPNQSWILYTTPQSLAHEFGHAFLLFSGAAWTHGKKVSKSAGVLDPSGKVFEGEVDKFIGEYASEKFASLPVFDPGALHFSPTVIRNWPEPPDFKPTFRGTWLEFEAKYPGAKVSEEKQKVGKQTRRVLRVCVPKPGEICPF